MSRRSEDHGEGEEEYTIKRRTLLGAATGIGVYSAWDFLDNGGIDGSPFRFISGFLNGGNQEPGGFNGKYAQNSNPRYVNNSSSGGNTPQQPGSPTGSSETGSGNNTDTNTSTEPSTPTDTDTPTDTSTDNPTPTSTPTPTETPTSTPTGTPTDTPTDTPTETSTPGPEYPELGPACDRLYIQESEDSNNGNSDGTVVAIDLADREYRIFATSDFPYNEELTGLYDEIVGTRGRDNLPGGLGSGVRTTRDEVFDYSVDAYDDMADEEEWDVIFDDNEETGCEM